MTIRELIAYNADRLTVIRTRPPIVLHVYYQLMRIIQNIDFDYIRTGILHARRTGQNLNRTIEFE